MAEDPRDPYPLMRLDYALKALKLRFSADNVVQETGRITLKLQYPGRQAPTFVSLTVEQAKVLAAHPISAKDLMDENFPPSWPGGLRLRSHVIRPAHRGAEPVSFRRSVIDVVAPSGE